MSHETKIEWTDRATNPIRYRDAAGRDVWACVKVSAGCKNCYAEATALRFEKGQAFSPQNMAGLTPYLRDKEVKELLSPKKTPAGSKVFVGDMTDVFGEWVLPDLIDGLFGVFARRPDVIFQVLTKRPERMARHITDMSANWEGRIRGTTQGLPIPFEHDVPWPLPNVWLGTSAENQQAADERIPHLLRVPAAVRFLSMEPLLGAVDLTRWIGPRRECEFFNAKPTPQRLSEGVINCERYENSSGACKAGFCPLGLIGGIGWVIVGGESGHGSRPMHPAWARSLRDQCQAAGVPFHFKQWGEWCPSDIAPKPEPQPTTILKGTPAECVVMQRPKVSFQVVKPDGGDRLFNSSGRFSGEGPTQADCWMHRVGKKAAGRLLDGRTWDETPEVACPSASS